MLLTSSEDTRHGKTLGFLSPMNPKEDNQDPWPRLLVRLFEGSKLRWSRLHSRCHSCPSHASQTLPNRRACSTVVVPTSFATAIITNPMVKMLFQLDHLHQDLSSLGGLQDMKRGLRVGGESEVGILGPPMIRERYFPNNLS